MFYKIIKLNERIIQAHGKQPSRQTTLLQHNWIIMNYVHSGE